MFIGRDLAHARNHSELVAGRIDAEIKAIVDDCYDKAKEIIMQNEEVLHKCADLLLEKERITMKEFEGLLTKNEVYIL